MSTHKYIDRICLAAALLSLLLALLFMNGRALGIQPASQVMGYEAKLFDTSKVHTIEIIMDDWDSFLETCESEEYAACSVVIDNEAYKNVGIRAKGNTSLSTVSQMGSDRYSFKVEFDQYDSGKTYYGLDKLCLNNLIQDNTMMKDYLTYRLMGEFGVAAPLCSYVYITVNGEGWGLYLAVEGVEDSFLQRNYGRDYGELYKPDSMNFGGGRGNGRDFNMNDFMNRDNGETDDSQPTGTQVSRTQGNAPGNFDSSSFSAQPNADGNESGQPEGSNPLTQFSGQFPTQDDGTPPEDFDPSTMFGGGENGRPEDGFDFSSMFGGMGSGDVKLQYTDDAPDSYSNIFSSAKTDVSEADQTRLIQALKSLGNGDVENALDIDQVLRYFVVHNFVVNGDSYTGAMVHNYYLYEEDGCLSMVPWDYNLAFGTFQGNDASSAVNDPIDSPLSVTGSGDRPMIDWIFSSEEYTQLYHQYFRQFLDNVDCAAIIEQAYALIAPYVEKDPTKFCTCEEFEAGVSALKDFCEFRIQSVSGQLDGSIPSTDKGQAADSSTLVDASGLSLSDMGTMGGGGGPGGGGFPGGSFGGPGDKSGMPQEGDNVPAFESNDSGGARQPPENMEMPGGFPGEGGNAPQAKGFPGDASAGIDATILVLTGISALVLLGGLLIAFQFKRPGSVRYGKTYDSRRAGPVSADHVRERHGTGRRP